MNSFKTFFSKVITESDDPFSGKLPELNEMETRRYFRTIEAAKFRMYKSHPFLGNVLQRLNTVTTYDVPTMGVDDKGNVYINPAFTMTMPFDQIVGVLAHETMHIATLTHHRQRGRDQQIWNIATDYIMNRDLLKSGFQLPAKGCLPDAQGKVTITSGKIPGKQIVIDINDMTAERLYTELLKNAAVIKQQPLDQVINSGDPKDGDGEGEEQGQGNKSGKPRPIPGSDAAGNKSPQQVKNDILTADEALKQQTREEKERGTGSAGIRDLVMQNIAPKVNWRQLLKNIVAKTVAEYDWKRPHKRAMAAGYYAPKQINRETLAPICVALDTSGSITDKEISLFVTECRNIFRLYPKATITIVLWESVTYYDVTITKQNSGNILGLVKANLKTGGTTMGSVAGYLKSKGLDKKVKAVVYLTDGYVEHNPAVLPPPCKNFALVTDIGQVKNLKSVPNLEAYPVEIN